jgi:hypothetical protein
MSRNLDRVLHFLDELLASSGSSDAVDAIDLIRSVELSHTDWSVLIERYADSEDIMTAIAFGLASDADRHPPTATLAQVIGAAQKSLLLRPNIAESCLTAIQRRLTQAERKKPLSASEARRLRMLLLDCLSGPWGDLFTMQTAVLAVLSIICYYRALTEVFPSESLSFLLERLIQVRSMLVEGPFAEEAEEVIACVRRKMSPGE